MTFLTARSENRREITLFLTGFFSSNFDFFSSNLEIFGNFASSWRQKSAQKHVFLRYEHIASPFFVAMGRVLLKLRRKKLLKACNLRYVHLDLRFFLENSTFFEKKSHESV